MLSDFENTKEDQITEQKTSQNKYVGLHQEEMAPKPSLSNQSQQVETVICPNCFLI